MLTVGALPVASVSAGADTSVLSAATVLTGFPRDLETDIPRGRMYVSDAPPGSEQGVVVLDLATKERLALAPVPEPTGLALSPSGSLLAVGSRNGRIYFVNPATFVISGSIVLSDTDPWYNMSAWDVAFDGEDVVYVSPGQPYGLSGGFFPIWVVNATAGREVSRIEGFSGGSNLHVDTANELLYVGSSRYIPDEIEVWDLKETPPTRLFERNDLEASSLVFSRDGSKLYLASGQVRNPLTLDLLGQAPAAGLVALSATDDHVFYAFSQRITRVNSSLEERGMWRFESSTVAWGPDPLTHIVASPLEPAVYVIVDTGVDSRRLDRIPLESEIAGLVPGDGEVVDENRWGLGFVVNGDVAWDRVRCWIDGSPASLTYDAYSSHNYGYMRQSPFPGGVHTVRVNATDRSGVPLSRTWTFAVDATPPEIYMDVQPVARTSSLLIHGSVLDVSSVTVRSWQGTLDLAPDNRSFALLVMLKEGMNEIGVEARDVFDHANVSLAHVLYVPSTLRYSDSSGYSIAYPESWSRGEQTIEGKRVVLFEKPSGEVNFNVIESGPLPGYTEGDVSRAALEAWNVLMESYLPEEPPSVLTVNGMHAATWSFRWPLSGLYQRQYLIASPWKHTSWIITFTSDFEDDPSRIDPFFAWLAATTESERPTLGPASTDGLAISAGLVLAAVGVLTAGSWTVIRRRRGASQRKRGPDSENPAPPPQMPPN